MTTQRRAGSAGDTGDPGGPAAEWGIITAAGRGSRLGGPKALLAWPAPEATPLACVLARALVAQGCRRVGVVTRASIARRLSAWLPTEGPVVLVASTAPDAQGPAGSIATAVRRLRPGPDEVVVVTPVDVHPDACRAVPTLVAALGAQGALAAVPRHGGRGGHPVVVRGSVLAPYRGGAPPLRQVLARLAPGARLDVEVDVRAVRSDLDEPHQLEALGLGPPRFL